MSDCGVCIGAEPEGYVEFSRTSIVKARKAHRCSECREVLAAGTKYRYSAWKFDGDFYDEKVCLECHEIRSAFACGNAYFVGELWSDMQENVFPIMTTACFDRLDTPAAKSFLQDKWIAWKGLSTLHAAQPKETK